MMRLPTITAIPYIEITYKPLNIDKPLSSGRLRKSLRFRVRGHVER